MGRPWLLGWLLVLVVALASTADTSGSLSDHQMSAELEASLQEPAQDQREVLAANSSVPLLDGSEEATEEEIAKASQDDDSADPVDPAKQAAADASVDPNEQRKLVSELKHRSPFESKPDPPLAVACFHKLASDQEIALQQAAKLKKDSRQAGEQYTAHGMVKREALQLSKAAQKTAEELQSQIVAHRKVFDLQGTSTKATLRLARAQSDEYNHFENTVREDVTKSKAAFLRYMQYKQLYIDSSANSQHPNTAEVLQYKKLAEQHLKAYSQLQLQINTARSNARGSAERYKALSKKYHGMVEEAHLQSVQLTKLATQHQRAQQQHSTERARYEKFALAESRDAARQKATNDQANEEQGKSNALEEQRVRAKRRYWELLGMLKKYTALAAEAKTVAEMQGMRFAKLNTKRVALRAEHKEQVAAAAALKEQMEIAQDASKVFSTNFKEAGCEATDAAGGSDSTSAQVEAARKNRKTDNPLNAATKPSDAAVLYHNLYSKFRQQYSTSLSDIDQAELGEKTYQRCQYFGRLASMYSQLQGVHQHLDGLNGRQLTVAQRLEQQKKARLNEVMVAHYTKEANRHCHAGRELLSVAVLQENDDVAEGAERCLKYKEVATSSLEAAATAQTGLLSHAKYMHMLKAELEETSEAAEDSSTQRDGAKARTERFQKIIAAAKEEVKHPCA